MAMRPKSTRLTLGVLALALLIAVPADAKRKKDYSDKLYNGSSIEEYCAGLLHVEVFDLSEDDLADCDRRYEEEVKALEDFSMEDVELSGTTTRTSSDDAEEESDEPKLSRKEREAQRLAEEEAAQERLQGMGLVDFGEESEGDAEEAEEGEDDLDEDLDEPDLEEEVDVFDDTEEVFVEDFDEGGSGADLEDLDDFGEEESDTGRKKKKKKKRGSSSTDIDTSDFPE